MLPGGHQHAGESVVDAARPECEEETGVTDVEVVPVCVMPYRAGEHQGLNFVFEAVSWQGDPTIAEPELFSGKAWALTGELPDPHAMWISDALRCRDEGDWFKEFLWHG